MCYPVNLFIGSPFARESVQLRWCFARERRSSEGRAKDERRSSESAAKEQRMSTELRIDSPASNSYASTVPEWPATGFMSEEIVPGSVSFRTVAAVTKA